MALSHSAIDVSEAEEAAEYYGAALAATYCVDAPGMAPAHYRGSAKVAAAMGINIAGKPTVEEVKRLIEGKTKDGKWLRKPPKNNGKKSLGAHDFTLSATKSMSLASAVGSAETKETMNRIQQKAVDVALERLQERVGWADLGRGKGPIKAEALIAVFPQADSRPVNGEVPDPDLHHHCVISATALCADGTFRALDTMQMRGVFNEVNALYLRTLGRELKAAGFELNEGLHAVELASINRDQIEHFSKRTSAIERGAMKAAQERGLDWSRLSRKERNAIVQQTKLKTRASKDATSEDLSACEEGWRRQAAEIDMPVGIDFKAGKPLTEDVYDSAERIVNLALDTEAAISEGTLDVLVSKATAARGMSEKQHAELLEAVRQNLLITGAPADEIAEKKYASRAAYNEEVSLLRDASEMASRKEHRIDLQPSDIKGSSWVGEMWQRTAAAGRDLVVHLGGPAAEVLARRTFVKEMTKRGLSKEQARAAYDVTRGDLALEEGAADVGKTFALKPIVDLYRDRGYNIVGISTAWKTAKSLREAEISEDKTLAAKALVVKLDAAEQKGSLDKVLPQKSLIVVDELSMLGGADGAALMKHANAQRCKVIAVGDRSQLKSPGRGDTMRRMLQGVQNARGKFARILTVVRQKTIEQREIANSFRDGEGVRRALEKMRERKNLHLEETSDAAKAKLTTLFTERLKSGAPPIVMCPTNRDANEASTAIRRLRRERGDIKGEDQNVEAQSKDGRHRWDLQLADGDRVRLLTKFREHGLFNGSSVVFHGRQDGKMRVEKLIEKTDKPTGEIVVLDESKMRDPESGRLALGYADVSTVHVAHGASRRAAIGYAPSGAAAMDANMAYSMASRHEHEFDMIVGMQGFDAEIRKKESRFSKPAEEHEVLDRLAAAMSKKDARMLATDIVGLPAEMNKAKQKPEPGALAARIGELRQRTMTGEIFGDIKAKVGSWFNAGKKAEAAADKKRVEPTIERPTAEAARVDFANSRLVEHVRAQEERARRLREKPRKPPVQ